MSVPETPEIIPHAKAKAVVLIGATLVLLAVFAFFVMSARGVFEETQELVLIADNSEGVAVGMDITFSGFPIGRVRRVELGDDTKAHIHIDIPVKDARWLRTSSIFTLERSLVGGTRIRAFSGVLDDPPLPGGARREVLIGDAAERIPQVLGTMQVVLRNLEILSAADSNLAHTLDHLRAVTGSMTGRYGVLAGVLGGEQEARKVIDAVDKANHLLAETNARLYGRDGLADEAQRTAREVRTLLTEARTTLQKLDTVLADVGKVAANARGATEDLDTLRAEVDTSLRRVSGLIDEINRKWPFARDQELKLP